MNTSVEPWLHKLTPEVLSNVTGFVAFLQSKMLGMENGCGEVETKLKELLQWRKVAKQVLAVKGLDNYIDCFTLSPQPFRIIEARHENKMVKVLTIQQASQRIQRSDSSESFEGKFSEAGEMFGPPGQLVAGYIFEKCLRKVRTKYESRDIYRAVKCEVDMSQGIISKVFSSEQFVIKRVGKFQGDHVFNERLRREFKVQSLLSELNHYGINQISSYHEDPASIFAVSFLAGEKDLLDALQEQVNVNKGPFCEATVAKLFKSVVESLLVAHNLGIAHRDVSLENLVVQESMYDVKDTFMQIIDWGHSCSTNNGYVKYEGAVGKERYFAPELVFRCNQPKGEYDPFKADTFSLGVCLFSTLVGQMPFTNVSDSRAHILKTSASSLIEFLNKKGNINLSEDALDLLNGCLKWDVNERYTMEEVLRHKFFSKTK